MKHFNNPTTLEELKKEYRKLALKHHPDCAGGDTETMKEVNAEYDILFARLKNVHKNKDGKTYEKATDETPDMFKDLITALMKMQGVTVEIIGCFVWAYGNTKNYKDQLKQLGFQWHSKKECWYKAPVGYRRYNKHEYSLNEIRDMYGVYYEGTGTGTEEEKTYTDNNRYIA